MPRMWNRQQRKHLKRSVIRFDESDVLSLIELWEEYSEFGANQNDDEETIDFESILFHRVPFGLTE
jgi:hypothetical protein